MQEKPKGAALLDGLKSSSWQSRIAVAIVAALLVLLLVQAGKDPGQFVSQLRVGSIIERINGGDNFMIGSFVSATVPSDALVHDQATFSGTYGDAYSVQAVAGFVNSVGKLFWAVSEPSRLSPPYP